VPVQRRVHRVGQRAVVDGHRVIDLDRIGRENPWVTAGGDDRVHHVVQHRPRERAPLVGREGVGEPRLRPVGRTGDDDLHRGRRRA
jgi:hypothetical protein